MAHSSTAKRTGKNKNTNLRRLLTFFHMRHLILQKRPFYTFTAIWKTSRMKASVLSSTRICSGTITISFCWIGLNYPMATTSWTQSQMPDRWVFNVAVLKTAYLNKYFIRLNFQLAPKVAQVLLEMFEKSLNIDTFHIVGHSLGGQLNGFISRLVKKQSKGEKIIRRITSLDPAFPQFYPAVGVTPVNKHDAEFVDIIHTDAFLYGAPVSTGTVDFWPNGGRTLQPGCPRRNYKFLSDNGKFHGYQYFKFGLIFWNFSSFSHQICVVTSVRGGIGPRALIIRPRINSTLCGRRAGVTSKKAEPTIH